MAIENAKTLNVRIKNKYDSYENWAKSGLVLEAGEIAIAYTTVNVDIGNGKIEQHPELLMKVGDGEKTFANLPWLSAKAADVAAWAKAAEKPVYSAAEITGIDAKIADYVSHEMGIEVDTDTQYSITKVNDYQYKLMSKSKADEAFATEVAVIDIPNDTAAIKAVSDLVGTDSVAKQIGDALAAYSTTEQMTAAIATAKSEATGHADGLNSAMDARVQVVEGKAHTHTFVETELNKIAEGDVEKWNKAEENAKGYADGLNTAMGERVTDLESMFGDGEGTVEAQIEAAVAAEAELREAADTGLSNRIKAIEDDYLVEADKTALQDQITVNAGDIDTLKGLVGTTPVTTQISDAVAEEAATARANEKANADAIGVLNGNSSVDGSVDKKIADAINTFATQMTDDKTVNTYKELIEYAATHGSEFTELVGEVDANTKAIETLNGDASTAGSVDKKIADAIAAENLSQYATGTELSGVDTRLQAAEAAVATKAEQADLTALGDRVTVVEGDLNAENTGLKAKMTAAEADIVALKEQVGTDNKSVAAQISEAIEALKIGDYAKAADLTAAIEQHGKDKKELEDAIALKANDADLAAIAKTGSTDDLVMGELVLVFDCGTSAV